MLVQVRDGPNLHLAPAFVDAESLQIPKLTTTLIKVTFREMQKLELKYIVCTNMHKLGAKVCTKV